MRQRSSKLLYAYWDELRAGRIAPRRFEIEPSRIAEILPDTFILERTGNNGFRFRLAGTRVCDSFGREFRGMDFMECWDDEDRLQFEKDMISVVKTGAVLVADIEASYVGEESCVFEILVLPLVHTGVTVDRFMGVVSSQSAVERPGGGATAKLNVLQTRLHVPPRGATVQIPDGDNPQDVVFQAHVRNARIVRQDRRSFRVYEGGLAGQPKDR